MSMGLNLESNISDVYTAYNSNQFTQREQKSEYILGSERKVAAWWYLVVVDSEVRRVGIYLNTDERTTYKWNSIIMGFG